MGDSMKIVLNGERLPWPDDPPTFRERRQAAEAMEVPVKRFVEIMTDPDEMAEREVGILALALIRSGRDTSGLLDLSPQDFSVELEPGDLAESELDAEADQLPPASSRDDEPVAAQAN